ncbi:hypothetical protein V1264_022150 [Littorina saxatilis]|uniref:FAD dependent oxidoreductase domain-containing protein n=2 Tax=Littorina saxatilis TaxID=31220 RepID=A0AAN9AJX2_9CAEN
MKKSGAPYTVLDSAAFKRQYPMLNYPSDYGGIYDPDGGLLRADRALNALQALFKRYGGEIRDGQRVVQVTPEGQGRVTVRTERDVFVTRSVVLCCGPWTSDLTSQLDLKLQLQPVRISVCYWKESSQNSHSYKKLPTFFEEKCCAGHAIYGLPSEEYPGCVKLCLHHGPEIHPDRRDVVDDTWVRRSLSQYVQRHFPGLEPTPAVVETCIYTNTPDRHFILDTHPQWKNIVIGAGFSGHGFKLAPVVGRVLSQLAQGKDPSYDLTPFRINRFCPSAQL